MSIKWFNYNAAAFTVSTVLAMTMYLLGAPIHVAIFASVMLFTVGMLAKDFTCR